LKSEWRLKSSYNKKEYSLSTGDKASLHKCSGDWKDLSNPNCPYSVKLFKFRLESIDDEHERKFIDIVKWIHAHEEYRRGTILETDPLSAVILNNPHLRTKMILTELMSQEDLIEC
jgi:hypothetical protein